MRRIIVLLAAMCVLFFALTGCGKENGDSTGQGEPDAQKGTLSLELTEGVKGAPNQVDFSQRDGIPLFKKYSYFVIGDTDFALVNKYAKELKNLRSRATRFSLTVQGTEAEELLVKRHMKSAMSLFGNAIDKYSTCFWHMSYVAPAVKPEIAQMDPENMYYYEPDYEIWKQAWTAAASYFKDKKIRSYYEVWNEPDQPYWTKFDWDGYIRMYQNTAEAVRQADTEAVIGGISASHLSVLGVDKYRQFLETMEAAGTPVDFVSFHDYDKGYLTEIPMIQAELSKRSDYYGKTQIMYTEFNVHNVPMNEWNVAPDQRTDFTLQKSAIVPEMIEAMEHMNRFTDVSVVQWAALLQKSSCFAMIDGDGNRSPAYWGQYLYAHMPVERVFATSSEDNIRILASSDEGKSAVMLCNGGQEDVEYSLDLTGIPYKKYDVRIYRIDREHASYLESKDGSDELIPTGEGTGLTTAEWNWKGKIPAGGTVYLEFLSGEPCPLEEENEVGYIVRTDHYYKDRTRNSYSDFDDQTAAALVGTGDSDSGRGCTAVTLRDVKDTIQVAGKQRLALQAMDENSYAGVRVDYHTQAGYTYAIAYVGEIYGSNRTSVIPFGTMRSADEIRKVDLDAFEMKIAQDAPEGWDGQVVITFDIENTGKNTEYKWTMR